MTSTSPTPSTPKVSAGRAVGNPTVRLVPAFCKPSPLPRCKNRRDVLGGVRGQGNVCRTRRTRPAPQRVRLGAPDPSLSSFGGLVAFNRLVDELGVGAKLRALCSPLKTGSRVVYSMATQVRLFLDLFAVGGSRLFDLERLAHDPLVCLLAGGALCSLDTAYRDVARFTDEAVEAERSLVAEVCLRRVRALRTAGLPRVHLDIDTTVLTVAGEGIEKAVVGYNPAARGHPSHHPVVAHVAEAGLLLGGVLRAGNTTFGADEAPLVGTWIETLREAAGRACLLYVRIDKAGHAGEILHAIETRGALYLVKAQLGTPLQELLASIEDWTTTERDADGTPLEQVAERRWTCATWKALGLRETRVVFVRSRERKGKECDLWPEQEMTVQAVLTNDLTTPAEDILPAYDGRAQVEPAIADGKGAWGWEHVSSRSFVANEALWQLKLLASNVLRTMAFAHAPAVAKRWRTPWLRALLLLRPARLVRSGRVTTVRLGVGPAFVARE